MSIFCRHCGMPAKAAVHDGGHAFASREATIDSEAVTPRPVTHSEIRDGGTADTIRDVIVAGILVLRDRDGLAVTDEQARERANNILMVLQGLEVLP